jgi:hypothetical protein
MIKLSNYAHVKGINGSTRYWRKKVGPIKSEERLKNVLDKEEDLSHYKFQSAKLDKVGSRTYEWAVILKKIPTRTLIKKIRRIRIKKAKIEVKLEVKKPIKKVTEVTSVKRRRSVEREKLSGIEIQNLHNLSDKYGIERDLVDWESYIDPSLSYNENKQLIEEHLKSIGGRKELDKRMEELKSEEQAYIGELKWRADSGDVEADKELSSILM